MNVGILGLGLIGGSMARAFAKAGHTVFACEKDESILSFAQLSGAVHGALDERSIGSCDLLLLAIYPDGSASYLEENAHLVNKNALAGITPVRTIKKPCYHLTLSLLRSKDLIEYASKTFNTLSLSRAKPVAL